MLEESCAHVGVETSRLYGMRLRIVDGGIRCGGFEAARGCALADGCEISVSTLAWISTAPPVSCVEDTPLPHEILHLRIGDGAHEDARWASHEYWEPLRRSLVQPDCSSDAATLLVRGRTGGPGWVAAGGAEIASRRVRRAGHRRMKP